MGSIVVYIMEMRCVIPQCMPYLTALRLPSVYKILWDFSFGDKRCIIMITTGGQSHERSGYHNTTQFTKVHGDIYQPQ